MESFKDFARNFALVIRGISTKEKKPHHSKIFDLQITAVQNTNDDITTSGADYCPPFTATILLAVRA